MNAKDPASRVAFIYGQPMKPCPKCGAYNMKPQTPIKMESIKSDDSAGQIVGKFARAVTSGSELEGPVFFMCFSCGHCGPSVDCAGRTREEVGRDKDLNAEIKRLWNAQLHNV